MNIFVGDRPSARANSPGADVEGTAVNGVYVLESPGQSFNANHRAVLGITTASDLIVICMKAERL